jgi:hypothetical protein
MQINSPSRQNPLPPQSVATVSETAAGKSSRSFADTMTALGGGNNRPEPRQEPRTERMIARRRERTPTSDMPSMPKPPKGGPSEPPRCDPPLPLPLPPTPKPVCDLPPPPPNPDPRYLGPPICDLPIPTPGPKPVPLPMPFETNPDLKPTREPITWPREQPIVSFPLPGGGVGARGPFVIECPAPVPQRTELFSSAAVGEATMADSE